MREILQAIVDAHAGREDLVMATIIDNVGSSPRSAGTKMLIKPDLSIIGTIGGGKLEANAIWLPKRFSVEEEQSFSFHFERWNAAKSDMIFMDREMFCWFPPWDDRKQPLYLKRH